MYFLIFSPVFVVNVSEEGYQNYIMNEFKKRNIYVQDVGIDFQTDNNTRNYTFIINMPLSISEEEIIKFAKFSSSLVCVASVIASGEISTP